LVGDDEADSMRPDAGKWPDAGKTIYLYNFLGVAQVAFFTI
jgi:hypothetical protein